MRHFRCVGCDDGFIISELDTVFEDSVDNGVGVCVACRETPTAKARRKKWQVAMLKAGWRHWKGGYKHRHLLLGHPLTMPECAMVWWQRHGLVPQIGGYDGK